MNPTVTRFAPSPSGALHPGNARTALFSFLLARRDGGRFLVRVEDSDRERSSEDFAASQLADLAWLGLHWDSGPDHEDGRGPYRQSQRGAIYARLRRNSRPLASPIPAIARRPNWTPRGVRSSRVASRRATPAPAVASTPPREPRARPRACGRRCASPCRKGRW